MTETPPPSRTPSTRRRAAALCVLLALLLVCTPLLASAHPLLMAAAGEAPVAVGAGDSTTHAHAHAAMPCHDGTSADTPLAHADCPHCSGDAPPNQCQCGNDAAPAGAVQLAAAVPQRITAGARHRAALPDPLPRSRTDRRFRPPIASR